MNSARVVGPASAGVLIATVGLAVCFLVNAASYVAVIVALSLMRTSELRHRRSVERAKGQVREGLRYVWSDAAPARPAARHGGGRDLRLQLPDHPCRSWLASPSTGAPARSARSPRPWVPGPCSAVCTSPHRTRPRIHACSPLVGIVVRGPDPGPVARAHERSPPSSCSCRWGRRASPSSPRPTPRSSCSSEPTMRGRVMALYAIAFLGSTPIGAPLVGADLAVPPALAWPWPSEAWPRCWRPSRCSSGTGGGPGRRRGCAARGAAATGADGAGSHGDDVTGEGCDAAREPARPPGAVVPVCGVTPALG